MRTTMGIDRRFGRELGLSLVEIMVSMVIGLFLVIGATTVYVNSRKSSDVDDSIARLQETARYAMTLIEEDVRMSNYWGLAKNGASVANKPTQVGAANSSVTLIAGTSALDCGGNHAIDTEQYIQGTNNTYPTTFPSATCGANTGAVASSDTLTVRRGAVTTSALDATRLQLCSNRSNVVIILGGSCSDEIHNLIVNTYYVDGQSTLSTTVPSLRRKTLGAGPAFQDVELVAGVEDMQVQFGWDSTGTSAVAAEYVNSNAVPAGGQIIAVRVWLLVRAETPDPTYVDTRTYTYADRTYTPGDNYRRVLVSRTFFIRNSVGT